MPCLPPGNHLAVCSGFTQRLAWSFMRRPKAGSRVAFDRQSLCPTGPLARPARSPRRAGCPRRGWLPVVSVASGGGGDRRTDSRNRTAEDVGALARRETWRQQTVVDFASYREAVELRGWNEQSRVRLAAVGGAFEIGFDECEDAIGVAVHTRHFCRVGVEQALAQILDPRLERAQ